MTNHWIDMLNADVVLIMGGNPAEDHPIAMNWLARAKEQGTYILHVDPRFNRTSSIADVFAKLRSGTDIAFVGGMINYAIEHNRIQQEYVREYTNASWIVGDGYSFTDGLFAGYDSKTRRYDKSQWTYALDGQGRPRRDPTLKHPRCVFQLLKQHLSRYDADAVCRSGTVLVPEGRQVFPFLSVAENLAMGAYTRRDPLVARDVEQVYEWFPRLRERRRQAAGLLSGGEQQMVAIGRALMARPTLMLLDEPSMGLAPKLVAEIYDIVARLNREEGVAVLLAEQNATMALQVAQHGYVMENGRIVLDGDAKTISQNEDIKEFYLGLTGVGQRKSYRDVKHYRRRKRWLS